MHPRRIRSVLKWGFVAGLGTSAGCADILGAKWDDYKLGGNQGGGTSSSSNSGQSGGGGQGGSFCVNPVTDCQPPGNDCVVVSCEAGECVAKVAPEKTACMQDGGRMCNASGECVDCIDNSDCASGLCEASACYGTCGSIDIVAMPSSCQAQGSGAGNDCGPTNSTNCCDNKLVPCGTYLRSYDGITYTDASYPATVSDFRLDTYDVTVGRFRAFVNAGQGTQQNPPAEGAGAHPRILGSGWDSAWNSSLATTTTELKAELHCQPSYATWTDVAGPYEKLPINCITWYEAFAFCSWDGGRLPTEAEWNYAAAGGNEQREYPWGTGIDPSYAVYGCTGDGSPAGQCVFTDFRVVGSRSPKGDGRWGQADLAGNIYEWILDWHYSPFPEFVCKDCGNISMSISGMPVRGARGGDFSTVAANLRSAFRTGAAPSTRDATAIGVRCARNP